MLAIGARSYLFGYRKNATTGKVISTGAGPGGSALTVSQSRAQLTMWSILKSPLLLSADFLEVVKWQTDPSAPQKGSGRDLLDIVRNAEVLAVSSDPLGAEGVRLEDAVTNHKSSPDVYVSQMRDGVYAVAMFNRNSSAGSLTFDIADLASLYAGSDKGLADAYHVRDLWKHTENGTLMTTSASTAFVAPVGGQDAVMMTLTPTSGRTSRLN